MSDGKGTALVPVEVSPRDLLAVVNALSAQDREAFAAIAGKLASGEQLRDTDRVLLERLFAAGIAGATLEDQETERNAWDDLRDRLKGAFGKVAGWITSAFGSVAGFLGSLRVSLRLGKEGIDIDLRRKGDEAPTQSFTLPYWVLFEVLKKIATRGR
ncbi:MAG: hypothetical protein FJX47_03530 [Alphaproteobacteria bacterium]|nr:hypothetical protein [Alphaproteobacteria bacterium]